MTDADLARSNAEPEELRVSTLELFFDLVFVFTLTQLTAFLEHDLSLLSLGRAVLIFVILFWMYGGYVWLTNQVPPATLRRRLLLIVGMGGFLICALAIPRAFEETGVAFGIGYLVVILVHGGLFAEAQGLVAIRLVGLNVIGARASSAPGSPTAGCRPRCGSLRFRCSTSPSGSARSCSRSSTREWCCGPRTSSSATDCC